MSQNLGCYRLGATQAIAFTGTSAPIASPFGAQTFAVLLAANAACHIKIGDGAQTATTDDAFLPANCQSHPIVVSPGQEMAAIRAATAGLVTATSGTVWVTELTR